MVGKKKKSVASKKSIANKKKLKREANRKKSLIYSLIALFFMILTFVSYWEFIIPAVFFLYLGRKWLIDKFE